jgi:glycine cleavage system aminomethyltransferase T/glycine/D-amino acid oxidase-like deaminating enzyme
MITPKRVVVIGGGIVGVSVAYHLAKLGWRDILVVDQGDLFENPGSTSHAPGGVIALSHSKLLTRMAQYGSNLYRSLAPFSPERNTYNWVGGLEVAISERRWRDLKRLYGEALSYEVEARLLTPAQAREVIPMLNEQAMHGALFVRNSALVAGAHTTAALARDAAADGAVSYLTHTEVIDAEIVDSRVRAALTNNPDAPRIPCEHLVIATNVWGPVLGDKLGVALPLLAYEHQYLITKPLPELARFDRSNKDHEVIYPTVRELDSTMYYRQHWDSYGIGSYHHRPRPVSPYAMGKSALRPFTPKDFFGDAFQRAQRLFPMFSGLGPNDFTRTFNGIFAFSVDGMPIIGESRTRGLWTAVASWLTHAGGVGKSLAEWMVVGETEWDLRQCHLHRFAACQTTRKYTDLVCDKNYAEVYEILHPRQPMSKPRNVRLTPFHQRHQELQASFTTFVGLELPNWYETNARLLEKYDDQIPERGEWAGQFWSRIQGAEHLETRNNVALFDLTGLSIIEISGVGSLAFVNRLCSNQMDKPVGHVVYTTWLTPGGGVRRDLAVAHIAADRFWMFVGEGTRPQDMDWVTRLAPTDGSVSINDVSDAWAALGMWGPNARRVLAKVTDADVSNAAFPYFTCRWIDIGFARVLALRISYAGELGWELHMPMDSALQVWDALWEAGQEFGMIAAGQGAFDSLRLEKGYRLWGTDVYTEYNPYESGLGWTVRLDKPDFVGREAAMRSKTQPLHKKLCCLTLDDRNAALIGYEPIFANGAVIGHVTSANFGYSVGKFIAYGYLPVEHSAVGTPLEIMYFGERYAATVSPDPLFDARMTQLKA